MKLSDGLEGPNRAVGVLAKPFAVGACLFGFLAPGASTAQDDESAAGEEPKYEIVEDITVTAMKREDLLQEVPMAVSVLGGEELERFDFRITSEIADKVPNLEIKSGFNASNPTIFLRGVGLNDYNANANGAVSLYADEVYLSAPSGQVLQMFDVERIEVLRGPQGTLYGKNTTGGAINLVTRKPSGDRGGYASLTLGRFDQVDFEGAFDTPFGDSRHAARIAVVSRHRDGHTLNLFDGGDENDVDHTAARASFRLAPRDDFFALVNVHGGVNRAGNRQYQSRGLLDGADAFGYVDSPDLYTGSYNRDTKEDIDLFGATLTLNWYSEGFTLTSISAYEESDKLALEDSDASPNQLAEIDWSNTAEQVSQEVRLASNGGERLDWLVGLFYFEEELRISNRLDFLRDLRPVFGFDPDNFIFLLAQFYDRSTTSWAPFGQISYRVSDRLTFQAGLRYTSEDKDLVLRTSLDEPEFSIPLIDFADSLDFDELSGEIGLSFAPREGMLVFGNVSRGFKSGDVNGGAFFLEEEASVVDPEFLTSFELGLKSSLLERRLRFNLTSFYYDYQDLQVFDLISTGAGPIQVLDNASDAAVKGLEVELRARPRRNLGLDLGVGLLDAEYRNFVRSDGTDLSGNELVSAPDWSVNAGLDYRWQLGSKSLLTLYLDYSHKDDVFLDANNTPRISSEDYGLLNGRFVFELADGKFSLDLWGKNLNKETYFIDIFDVADLGFDELVVGDPRTYGVQLTVRY